VPRNKTPKSYLDEVVSKNKSYRNSDSDSDFEIEAE
jgi:hypothetical protein